jgi:hypothetical protein
MFGFPYVIEHIALNNILRINNIGVYMNDENVMQMVLNLEQVIGVV